MNQDALPAKPSGPSIDGPHRPPANEEPEFNSERDIPTEDADDDVPAAPDNPADDESVAGEEDPGAAWDTARPPSGRRAGG